MAIGPVTVQIFLGIVTTAMVPQNEPVSARRNKHEDLGIDNVLLFAWTAGLGGCGMDKIN